jgi:cephalosporin hydroxylase
MNEPERFREEVRRNIEGLREDRGLRELSRQWMIAITRRRYAYNFTWLGRPIIQVPQDLLALQEIVWRTRPELIVETGIAHGGSLIFSASLLELIGGAGRVIGVDIDIRAHNRVAIERHPLSRRITMIEGSSIDPGVVRKVADMAAGCPAVMVILDSNHTRDHVAEELRLYAPLVTRGHYLVVFDTVIEDLPGELFPDRPWGPGDNPKTAVHEFLKRSDAFEIDREVQDKLLITVAPDGYLRRVKD